MTIRSTNLIGSTIGSTLGVMTAVTVVAIGIIYVVENSLLRMM